MLLRQLSRDSESRGTNMRVANYASIKAMSLDEITQRLSVDGKKKSKH